jgi:hypothetical protein
VSRREAWLSAALVFVVAVAVRVWATSVITFPRPEDTAYYVGVARNLVEGRGLVSDAIWSYATPPLAFPRPAFEVWLPLPSFLAALPMAILGTTFAAAQWSSIVVGGLVAVLAWRLAADVAEERSLPVGRARTLGLGTGLSAAAFLPLVLHSVLPDSTMLFGALVLATCLLGTRVGRDPRGARLADPRVLGIGVLLGFAALTRNEAIWLALAWVILARGAAAPTGAGSRGWARLVVGAAIPALLVFVPWAIRDWVEFGSPFPGQALANALYLDGRDIFAWQETPTLSRYLDAGLGTLIGLRWTGFLHNLVNVLLLLGVPLSAIGLLALPWTLTARAFAIPQHAPAAPAPTARYVRADPVPLPPPPPPPPAPRAAAEFEDPAGLVIGRQAERPPAWMERPRRAEGLVTPTSMSGAESESGSGSGAESESGSGSGSGARSAAGPTAGAMVMLEIFSGLTLVATTLLFPVSTTWGTFLHTAAAVQVLLLISALLALDRLIQEAGRRRGWTRPVAWLGPCLGIAAGTLFTLALLPGFGRDGDAVRDQFEALPAALAAAGVPLEVRGAPVITDFPIYLAEETGAYALALPEEPPASVVDLAAHFPGTRLLLVASDDEGIWPEAALADSEGLACFDFVPLDLEGWDAYLITCP